MFITSSIDREGGWWWNLVEFAGKNRLKAFAEEEEEKEDEKKLLTSDVGKLLKKNEKYTFLFIIWLLAWFWINCD